MLCSSPNWRSFVPSSCRPRASPAAAPTSTGRRAAEIAWAVLPGIALAVVLVVHLARDARDAAVAAPSLTGSMR